VKIFALAVWSIGGHAVLLPGPGFNRPNHFWFRNSLGLKNLLPVISIRDFLSPRLKHRQFFSAFRSVHFFFPWG